MINIIHTSLDPISSFKIIKLLKPHGRCFSFAEINSREKIGSDID